ncbi:hypothetical protein BT63DRAFT_418113 [Microthyrium microscopicum]|uniref:Uncharacterized protein n=1 Tax=Microthyrium microscopicum TaxID=703497 RepID=A0A6A6U1G0_9PEZI|nr:hypothetical protein BT63DRAFT_418113 [Microthyrium microscopicum]
MPNTMVSADATAHRKFIKPFLTLSLDDFLAQHADSAILSLEVGGRRAQIREIGFLLCPSITHLRQTDKQRRAYLVPDGTFGAFIQEASIESFSIPVLRMAPEHIGKKRERYKHGKATPVEATEVEATAEATILQALENLKAGRTNLIVLTFGGREEMIWLQKCCPRLLKLVSAWADLSDFVTQASGHKLRGLYDSCLSLGITEHRTVRRNKRHSAGNDGIRNFALLTALLHREPDSKMKVYPTAGGKRPLFRRRPYPEQRYPLTAKIEAQHGTALPYELRNAEMVLAYLQKVLPKDGWEKNG